MHLTKRLLGRWYDVPSVKLIFELLFIILPAAFLIRTFGFGLYQVPTGSMEPTLLVGERFFADKLTYWFRAPKRGEIIAFNAPDKSVCSQGYQYSHNPVAHWFEQYVWGPSNWTKRVIGIPGDHVHGTIEDGHSVVYLNGVKLDESAYVNKYPLIMLQEKPYSYLNFDHIQREFTLKTFDPTISWDKQPFYKIKPQLIPVDNQTNKPYILESGTPHPRGKDEFDIHLGKNQYWVMGDNRLGSGDSREWGPLDGNHIHGKIIYRIWSMDTNEAWWFIDLLKHPINFFKKVRWSRCMQFVH